MTAKRMLLRVLYVVVLVACPLYAQAAAKRGLLIHNSIYGSTVETAYWVRALIGYENYLEVKALPQVVTLKPYDYIIIGSLTRDEKPTANIYEFLKNNADELSQKQVCYYLTCGDTDETMVLNIPGKEAHLIGGRNYLLDVLNKFPAIQPVVIGGFGGRQVLTSLNRFDAMRVWLVGKLAKEGAAWEGLDIWESLVPERVEAFANEVRSKILGLGPAQNPEQWRLFWESLQPGSITDPSKKKYAPRAYTEHKTSAKIVYVRTRMPGSLNDGTGRIQKWAEEKGFTLTEKVKTFYNAYYHATKKREGQDMTVHIVAATLPEDPGNVHFSLRNYDKQEKRQAIEEEIVSFKKKIESGM